MISGIASYSAPPMPIVSASGGESNPAESAAAGTDPSREQPAEVEGRREVQQRAFGSSRAAEQELPPQQKAEVAELKRRDQEVRTHEAAHISAGGAYVLGGASYTYSAGPDGKRYAVGGEVSIDTSPVAGNPEATVAKMQTVRRAALAPAQPSGQDLSVAARAAQAEIQARAEAAHEARAEENGETAAAQPSREEDPNAPDRGLAPSEAVGPPGVQAPVGTHLDAYA